LETRINKYLSEVGFCSRREADRLLEQGRITINGKKPELGTKVSDADEIFVDGKNIKKQKKNTFTLHLINLLELFVLLIRNAKKQYCRLH
jgi:16S rRNA U516 pseudouridylate synthase RsuA-like enzyme